MQKNQNIFVRIQLEKDPETNDFGLNVYFDKTAPNFSVEQNGISWSPTLEELNFIIEAFGMIAQKKPREKTWHHEDDHETIVPPPTVKIREPEHSPYEKKIAITADSTVVEPVETDNPYVQKKGSNVEKIFIQADEKTIDEALKRRKTGSEDEYMGHPDDQTSLDRILKQKKKK